jgi:hypothetical protein
MAQRYPRRYDAIACGPAPEIPAGGTHVFELKRLGLAKRPDPTPAGSSIAALVERSGDLKQELVAFAEDRFERARAGA